MSETEYPAPRRYQRAKILCPLTLCSEGTLERFEATGLNEGGLLLLSRTPIKIESPCHLIFELPDGKIIEADGEVSSTKSEVGLGIRFTSLDPQDRESISRAVEAALSEAFPPPEEPPTPEQVEAWKKLRAEPRVTISFEVSLEGCDEMGEAFTDRGRTYDVSRHGAAVWVSSPYEPDQQIQLIGPEQRFTAPAVVRNCTREDDKWRIGLQLLSVPEEWVIR